jgi:hypothetical protein
VLRRDAGQDRPRPQVIVKGRKGRRSRRRQTEGLGWVEAFTHETARAASAGVDTYLKRHERSNKRKRDGWIRDLPDNMWSAYSKSKRQFRLWTPSGR